MLKLYQCPIMVYLRAQDEYEARETVLRRVNEVFDAATVFPAEERSQDASQSDHPRHKQRRGGRTRRVKV